LVLGGRDHRPLHPSDVGAKWKGKGQTVGEETHFFTLGP